MEAARAIGVGLGLATLSVIDGTQNAALVCGGRWMVLESRLVVGGALVERAQHGGIAGRRGGYVRSRRRAGRCRGGQAARRRRGDARATAFRRRNGGAFRVRWRVRAGGCGDGPCH